jgi:putative endonuclease
MLGALYRIADYARDCARRRQWDADLATGRKGEDIAHRFLQRSGMIVVARNHRTASGSGEVDLIAWDDDALVFVEVKSRGSEEFGTPDRAVDDEKRNKLLKAALDYARRADVPMSKFRFDVVTVVFGSPPRITHLKDVFTIHSLAQPDY